MPLLPGREDVVEESRRSGDALQVRVAHSAVVVQRDCDELVAMFKQELNRFFCFLRRKDGFAQARRSVLLIVDGLQLHIRRHASFEGQTVPHNGIKIAV